jgi:hypothetical protein
MWPCLFWGSCDPQEDVTAWCWDLWDLTPVQLCGVTAFLPPGSSSVLFPPSTTPVPTLPKEAVLSSILPQEADCISTTLGPHGTLLKPSPVWPLHIVSWTRMTVYSPLRPPLRNCVVSPGFEHTTVVWPLVRQGEAEPSLIWYSSSFRVAPMTLITRIWYVHLGVLFLYFLI